MSTIKCLITINCITTTTTVLRLSGFYPGLSRWAGTRKVKPKPMDFLEQETVSGSGISWAICKSATHISQITTTAPQHSVFTGRIPSCRPTNSVKALKAWIKRVNNGKTDTAGTSVVTFRMTNNLLLLRHIKHQRRGQNRVRAWLATMSDHEIVHQGPECIDPPQSVI